MVSVSSALFQSKIRFGNQGSEGQDAISLFWKASAMTEERVYLSLYELSGGWNWGKTRE
jgi:hypothetical protein